MRVKFTVLGEPRGKGRPRFARQGNFVRTYTPEATASYENLIATEYRRQCHDAFFPKGTPVDVRIMAYYGIPASDSKKKRAEKLSHRARPTKKVDVDNLVKCYMDAANGVIFQDDVQVVDLQVRKFYSERPRVVVTIQDAAVRSDDAKAEIEKISAEIEEQMRKSWGADYPGGAK